MIKSKVHSFDAFDTLIGRIHKTPESIFDLIEKKFPFENFKVIRQFAESMSNGTLDDIYEHFAKIAGLDDSLKTKLLAFEIACEKEHIFPIQCNINQIQDGDIIVSDTYYNENQLRELLQKIGVNKKVHVFAGPGLKSHGGIWKTLLTTFYIEKHLGDNLHTDIASPKAFGIQGMLFNPDFSDMEKTAVAFNHPQLAHLMRSVRLANPYLVDSYDYHAWNEQAQWNIPILVLASNTIEKRFKEKKCKKILFQARDCVHLIKIFNKIFPEIESVYFYASRAVCKKPSFEYIQYVRENYTPKTMLVDVGGSGNSINYFFSTFMAKRPAYVLINQYLRKTKNGIAFFNSHNLEMLNYAKSGSLLTFSSQGPVFLDQEYPDDAVNAAHACIDFALKLIPFYDLKQCDDSLIGFLIKLLDFRVPCASRFSEPILHVEKQALDIF